MNNFRRTRVPHPLGDAGPGLVDTGRYQRDEHHHRQADIERPEHRCEQLVGPGGAFGFQLPEVVSRFSLLYWGSGAFQKLANGSTDIGLNLVVLFALGAVMFTVGFWMFNRRLDV